MYAGGFMSPMQIEVLQRSGLSTIGDDDDDDEG